jgi:2-polyprenyl-3-methyl-5-hydroxy-6-metoxy-1,4-benzoquinol methylase
MPDLQHPLSIEEWLAGVRAYFMEVEPDLLPLFNTYAEEATFGRRYIGLDLQCLLPGSKVLEVGAGSMLLSCQLVREGLAVTGLEPTGFGFAHFERMRELILECAKTQGCLPEILDSTAEALTLSGCFDYAFSINVMEHVDDVKLTLSSISRSLKPGATYRFTCPNYLFPYEPHFNIPTLFSKQLTERLLHRKIHARAVPDPSGLWKSLNWINVSGIRRMSKHMVDLQVTFNTAFLVSTLERVTSDPNFAERRSPLTRRIILLLMKFRLHHLFRFMPAIVQPIIDCRIEKILRTEKK